MHLVRLDSIPPQPWRNGGGTARDLLAWPTAAPPGEWQLRVSVAAITRDGPFSAYAGIDRWFAVVEGHGVQLDLPCGTATVRQGDAPLYFDGADTPGCRLLDGPTEDLNFMARRDGGRGRLQAAQPGQDGPGPAVWRAFYTAEATVLRAGSARIELPAASLLWSEAGQATPWHWPAGQPGARGWWMQWTPSGSRA